MHSGHSPSHNSSCFHLSAIGLDFAFAIHAILATESYSDTEVILMTDWVAASGRTVITLCNPAVGNWKLLALYKKGVATEIGLHIHSVTVL